MNQLLSTVRRLFKLTKNEKAIIQNGLNRKEIMDGSGNDQSQGPCGREAAPGSKSSCYSDQCVTRRIPIAINNIKLKDQKLKYLEEFPT